MRIYQVKTGDTLKTIAVEHLGAEERWQEIAIENNISWPYYMRVGQLLVLPEKDSGTVIVKTPNNVASPKADTTLSPAYWMLWAGGIAFFVWMIVRKK